MNQRPVAFVYERSASGPIVTAAEVPKLPGKGKHRFSLRLASQGQAENATIKGMKELDNFGFRTAASQLDPTGFLFLTEKQRKDTGFHVSDLWSQRQQQEFLRTLRLEKAQFARERHTAFMNFLMQTRKKLLKPSETDMIYQRILHDANPELAAKWKNTGRKGALLKQVTNQVGTRSRTSHNSPENSASPLLAQQTKNVKGRRRLSHVDALIGHCQSTLKTFHKSTHLSPLPTPKQRSSIV